MEPSLLVTTKDRVTTLTLNRPDRLNAIDIATLDALVDALETAAKDDDVRAIVLAGNGRAFCSGADHAEMVPRSPKEWEAIVDRYLGPIRAIVNMDKPVIARCHGDVIGGGFGIALSCDFRIAAEGSRYCAPFVKIGLAGCDMSAGYFLPRLIGLGRATDLMMTGRFVEAAEAKEIGLITALVPADALDEAVAKLARNMSTGAAVAIAATKRALRRSLELGMESEFDYETFVQVQCLQTEDHREAVKAFAEKRRPVFHGK